MLNIFTKTLKIIKLREDAKLPLIGSEEAAGMDVHFCPEANEANNTIIGPHETFVAKTGLTLGIPKGYHVEVRSRSGLAAKNSINVLNSPGTIDSDYTGELMVILHNNSNQGFKVSKGDRIAQILLRKNVKTKLKEVSRHSRETTRGSGGFGSTGK